MMRIRFLSSVFTSFSDWKRESYPPGSRKTKYKYFAINIKTKAKKYGKAADAVLAKQEVPAKKAVVKAAPKEKSQAAKVVKKPAVKTNQLNVNVNPKEVVKSEKPLDEQMWDTFARAIKHRAEKGRVIGGRGITIEKDDLRDIMRIEVPEASEADISQALKRWQDKDLIKVERDGVLVKSDAGKEKIRNAEVNVNDLWLPSEKKEWRKSGVSESDLWSSLLEYENSPYVKEQKRIFAGAAITIPELSDVMKEKHPSMTSEMVKSILKKWHDDDRISLTYMNDMRYDKRSKEGISAPSGMFFFVRVKPGMYPPGETSPQEKNKDAGVLGGKAKAKKKGSDPAAKPKEEYWGNDAKQPFYRPGPNPTVDNVITRDGPNGLEVLMIRRKEGKAEGGKWALPGGFHDPDPSSKKGDPWKEGKESARGAAIRELMEETKLDLKDIESNLQDVGTYETGPKAKKKRDPRDNKEAWSKSTAFRLHLSGDHANKPVEGNDDADRATWVPVSQLKKMKLAFDHGKILKDAGVLGGKKMTVNLKGKKSSPAKQQEESIQEPANPLEGNIPKIESSKPQRKIAESTLRSDSEIEDYLYPKRDKARYERLRPDERVPGGTKLKQFDPDWNEFLFGNSRKADPQGAPVLQKPEKRPDVHDPDWDALMGDHDPDAPVLTKDDKVKADQAAKEREDLRKRIHEASAKMPNDPKKIEAHAEKVAEKVKEALKDPEVAQVAKQFEEQHGPSTFAKIKEFAKSISESIVGKAAGGVGKLALGIAEHAVRLVGGAMAFSLFPAGVFGFMASPFAVAAYAPHLGGKGIAAAMVGSLAVAFVGARVSDWLWKPYRDWYKEHKPSIDQKIDRFQSWFSEEPQYKLPLDKIKAFANELVLDLLMKAKAFKPGVA